MPFRTKNKKKFTKSSLCFCLDKTAIKRFKGNRICIIIDCLLEHKDGTVAKRELKYEFIVGCMYIHNEIKFDDTMGRVTISMGSLYMMTEKLAHVGTECLMEDNSGQIVLSGGHSHNVCYKIYAARGNDQYALMISPELYYIHIFEPFIDALLTLLCIMMLLSLIIMGFITQMVVWY